MSTELIVGIGKKLFSGLAILTASVLIYAIKNDYELEVESPFFGKWKLSKASTNSLCSSNDRTES